MYGNSRRMVEMLVLGTLTQTASPLLKDDTVAKTRKLFAPFEGLTALNDYLQNRMHERDHAGIKIKASKAIDILLPPDNRAWPAEWTFWYVTQMVKRFIGTGWRPPKGEISATLIQGLYDAADEFQPKLIPYDRIHTQLMQTPELAKRLGLFQP